MEEYLFKLVQTYLDCPVTWGHFGDGQAPPRAAINRVSSGQIDHTLAGEGLWRTRVQVDLFHTSAGEAITLGRGLVRLLEAHRGGPIMLARLEALRDGIEGDASILHRVSLTFSVTHRE